ncbi:unnamed protein product [Ambrosiozyma monospora]|uniref:Unnamed protein product n=1 Tax=Ambrosiozyma monospora TaxID=43982 RepID=A0A9W7DKI9_AMBMO|nr:unnamed protein product [Ambrosiozyma monospora]
MAPITRVKAACQKCRSLRHRCDFKYPKCSRCERAKINCVVQDPITKVMKLREEYGAPPGSLSNDQQQSLSNSASQSRKGSLPESDHHKKSKDQFDFTVGLDTLTSLPFTFKTHQQQQQQRTSGFIPSHSSFDSNSPSPPEFDRLVRLPSKNLTLSLVRNYFDHSWNEHPILRNDGSLNLKIEQLFNELESKPLHVSLDDTLDYLTYLAENFSSIDLFFIYITMAIGSFISPPTVPVTSSSLASLMNPSASISSNSSTDPKTEADAYSYYLTSTIFLNKFLHVDLPKLSVLSMPKTNSIQLKSLQALLLLATFGLLKPIKPGVWYILLLASDLINDMELYSEEALQSWEHFYGASFKNNSINNNNNNNNQLVPHTMNIKVLDLNDLDCNHYSHTHRLTFWSFYSLERQVCCFVDKPFTLSDPDITALPITTIMNPLQDDNLSVPSFFSELRNLQGKIHQFTNGSRTSGFSLLNYINLDNFTFQTHKALNGLVLKFLDTISITRNPRLKNAVQTISDFAVLNYFSLIHSLYKPTINRAKLSFTELELLFKISSQIVMTYDKLDNANKMTFKYMSIEMIHQAYYVKVVEQFRNKLGISKTR